MHRACFLPPADYSCRLLVATARCPRNTGKERGHRRPLADTIFRPWAMLPELTSGFCSTIRPLCFEPRATVYRLICR